MIWVFPIPMMIPLSAEERFLQRQEQQSAMGASNALHRANSPLWQKNDLTSDSFQREMPNPGLRALLTIQFPVPPVVLQRFSDSVRTGWGTGLKTLILRGPVPFSSPEPIAKPTPEQLAGMDRFRAMMEPPAQYKTSQASLPVMTPDPNMQDTPVFNPAGNRLQR